MMSDRHRNIFTMIDLYERMLFCKLCRNQLILNGIVLIEARKEA